MNRFTFFFRVLWGRHTYKIGWIMAIIGAAIWIGSFALPTTIAYSNVTTITSKGITIGPQPYTLPHPLAFPVSLAGIAVLSVGILIAAYVKVIRPTVDKFKDLYEEDWKHP